MAMSESTLVLVRKCCDRRGFGRMVVPFEKHVACHFCGWTFYDVKWSTACPCGSGKQVPICLTCCQVSGIEDVRAISRPVK